MRAVNLLPRDEARRSFEARRGVAFGAAGGVAVLTVVLAAAMISASGATSEQQARIDALNAELASLPEPTVDPDADSNAMLAVEKAARVGALSAALGGRVAWDRVLREISQVLPTDVWLASLASAGGPSASPGATSTARGIILNGSTYSQDGVARLLSRLSVTPSLTNVRLSTSAVSPLQTRVVQFTILADLRTAAAAS